jgi:hypothetical protein
MAVLLALAGLVELGVVVTLLEVSLSRRGGGNANNCEAAEHDSEGHQGLHFLLPKYQDKAQTGG